MAWKFRWPYSWRKIEGKPVGIPYIGGIWYIWDCIIENVFIRLVPLPMSGVYKGQVRDEKIIISLTSFPARIDVSYYAIKSLMLQSCKADRIILWLAETQFPDHQVPRRFKKLTDRGLEIRFCDDLRSHKKYFYALQEQKSNELIVTYDDDIIYESDSIEKLLRAHRLYPDCIICNRGNEITLNPDRSIKPYGQWKIYSDEGVGVPSMLLQPSTGAGCMYPYGCMPESTFDLTLMQKCAWSADDLWMRFNSIQNGIRIVKTRKENATLCLVFNSQMESLTTVNNIGGENDRVLDRLLKQFPFTSEKLQ